MKRLFRIFLLFLLIAGITGFVSCSSKTETTGSLTITVQDLQGNVIPGVFVNLATSLENLKNKVYLRGNYTDNTGSVIFRELAPMYYYFSANQYKGIGGDKVFATVDQYTILFVETLPEKSKTN